MNNKHLYIFTVGYPYGSDENYLNDEIIFLAKKIGRITIICPKIEGRLRYLPHNVSVIPVNISFLRKIIFGILSLFSQHFILDIKRIINLKKPFINSIKTLLYSLNQISIAKILYRACIGNINVDYDNIYYGYWSMYPALAAIMCNRRIAGKVVSRMHGWDIYEHIYTTGILPLRYTLNASVDYMVFLSEQGRKYYFNSIDGEKSFASVIFSLGCSGDDNFKVKDKSNHIVSCSRIVPMKRLKLIIDAISNVNIRPLYWTHLGGGENEDEIVNYAKSVLSVKGINFTITSTLPHDKILEFYREVQGDIFINVSESEGMPVSIMEAMAHGLIIIATDVGGTSSMLKGDFSRLVNKDITAKELGIIIGDYLDLDDAKYRDAKLAARAHWRENYNKDKNYSDFANFLVSLLD